MKNKTRKTQSIAISDPDQELYNTVQDAISKHENRLYRDERSVQSVLRLIIKNMDICLEAIRPTNPNK